MLWQRFKALPQHKRCYFFASAWLMLGALKLLDAWLRDSMFALGLALFMVAIGAAWGMLGTSIRRRYQFGEA